MARRTLELTSGWEFREVETSEVSVFASRQLPRLTSRGWLSCAIPGSTVEHLLEHKVLPNPLQNSNELRWQGVEKADYIYRCTFDLSETWQSLLLEENERIDLFFNRLDCFAQVYLNGELLLESENAFVPQRVDVTNALLAKGNELLIHVDSALNRAAILAKKNGVFPAAFESSRVHTRRPAFKTGSRSTPRLSTPEIGAVELQHFQGIRLRDALANVEELTANNAKVTVDVGVESFCDQSIQMDIVVECLIPKRSGGQYSIEVVANFEKSISLKKGRFQFQQSFKLRDPLFWWPVGYGDPGRRPLYRVRIAARRADVLCDSKQFQFGLRTITPAESQDEGVPFYFNGSAIYLRGTTILPLSCMTQEQNPQEVHSLIERLAAANVNAVRVWGGGGYASTAFFNACDEFGILVIQEFPFSQANYPDEKDFWKNVQIEATHHIRELRNHASLALWVGKDGPLNYGEMTQFKGSGETRHRIFRSLLPQLVESFDGTRPYVATLFKNNEATSLNTSDLSQARLETLPAFLASSHPFVAAFGLPSLPTTETTAFAEQEGEEQPVHTTPQQTAGDIMQGIIDWCGEPRNQDEVHYLSQWIQGNTLSRGIDHWRTQRPTQQGMLHWHFNDCAPRVSSSLLDFMRKPKLGYWFLRQAYSPVSLIFTIAEEGVDVKIDAQPGDWEGNMPMTCRLKTYHVSGKLLSYKDVLVRVNPKGVTNVGFFTVQSLNLTNPSQLVLAGELFKGSKHVIASRLVTFERPKNIKLEEPELMARLDFVLAGKRAIYQIRSKNIIRNVDLNVDQIPGAELRQENGFDLWPSREVWVQLTIQPNTPPDLLLTNLRFRCLNDLREGVTIDWRPIKIELDEKTPLAIPQQEDFDSQSIVTRLRTTDVIPKLFDSKK